MKFDVENMQEFKNLLDQASVKTGKLIEILQRINEFEFKAKKEPSFNEETRLIRCPYCHYIVTSGNYCVQCGYKLTFHK